MNIFIDESGSFVNATEAGSWNSIAAYMSPENDRKRLRETLAALKRDVGVSSKDEIKLKHLNESQYFCFLEQLGQLHGVLFAVATDAGLNPQASIAEHQRVQAEKIVEHKDKMIHQSAADGIQNLSERIEGIAPQLYVQLQCQVALIDAVIRDGVLYFVQRMPRHLGNFRWKIDQKNSIQTEYETAFVTLLPAFLQSSSLREPFIMLRGADYTAFSRFDYSKEEQPTYLKDTYGIDTNENELVTNIGMLIRESLDFVDSKQNQGVQVADLLASGVRRCLRQGFDDNDTAAHLMGRLMVQNVKGDQPIHFLSLTNSDDRFSDGVSRLSNIMEHSRKAMIASSSV